MIEKLIDWYERNKRNLPWRDTRDPYKIWVSEIILQQTRVEQGRGYYLKFLERFPDVKTLAEATQEEVLMLWQGLGYYSRARNMHAAAMQVMQSYGGDFPDNYQELLKLKGIGPYTAAAVASFAFNKPHPAIDGNVNRVISRLFLVEQPVNSRQGQKVINDIAVQLIPHHDPATYNQAMMEFGALQCVPSKPVCPSCPLKDNCLAFREKKVDTLPVKVKSKVPWARYLNYLVVEDGHSGKIMLTKRENQKDIWYNLYEFPVIESATPLEAEKLVALQEFKQWIPGNEYKLQAQVIKKKHQLSHQTIHAYFWRITAKDKEAENTGKQKPAGFVENLHNYPLPRLISSFAEENLENFQKK